MADLRNINYDGLNLTVPEEHVELTQAQYDALSEAEKKNGKVYFITDGINSNVVLNENNGSKAFVSPYTQGDLHRIQLNYRDSNGNVQSACNIDYGNDGTPDVFTYPRIEQYHWDESFPTQKWRFVAQYLPTDEDKQWKNLWLEMGVTANNIYVFRRNEWVSFALRNTININVPAKQLTRLIDNMPDRYSISEGVIDFTIAVSPVSGTLIPAFLRFTHVGDSNVVDIWSEQALTANTSSWFGCITYPAMPRY